MAARGLDLWSLERRARVHVAPWLCKRQPDAFCGVARTFGTRSSLAFCRVYHLEKHLLCKLTCVLLRSRPFCPATGQLCAGLPLLHADWRHLLGRQRWPPVPGDQGEERRPAAGLKARSFSSECAQAGRRRSGHGHGREPHSDEPWQPWLWLAPIRGPLSFDVDV